MNMPVLKDLLLGNSFDKSGTNNITRVSALNKCAFSSLTNLDLSSCLSYGKVVIECDK